MCQRALTNFRYDEHRKKNSRDQFNLVSRCHNCSYCEFKSSLYWLAPQELCVGRTVGVTCILLWVSLGAVWFPKSILLGPY